MRRYTALVVGLLGAFTLASACGKDSPSEPTPPSCSYTVTGNPSAAVAAGASEFTMSISTGASCAWTASSSASFITAVGSTSGSGPGGVKFSVAENTGVARQGSVTVAGQAFQINQAAPGPGCSYSVAPASTTAPQTGGDLSFDVTAGADCAWTTTVTDAFVTIKQGATGTGNGKVVLTVAPNSGSSRNGSATIAGTAVTIAQDGPPSAGPSTHAVVLSLQPDPGELITEGQSLTFTAFAPQQAGVEADVSSPGVRIDGRGTDGHNWTLRMANTSPQRPAAGFYNNAIKAGTFPTGYPMLDFTLDGRKCSTLTGRFLVAQATYGTNNTVIRFHAKFEMFCDGASMRLVGEIWVDAAGSTVVPAMGSLPAPGPPNSFFTFQSPPGEPAGLGQSKSFNLANARLFAGQAFGPGILVSTSNLPGAPTFNYQLVLVAPSGQLLTPGTYNNARLYPNQPPPGMYFYNSAAAGPNPICTTVTGKFVVLEAVWGPNSEVFRFRATFEYSCNGFMPPLTGEVYIVADPWR